MITGYIVTGKLIDKRTIRLSESVPFDKNDITVFLEPAQIDELSERKKAQLKLATLRGKVRWEGNLDEMRQSRI